MNFSAANSDSTKRPIVLVGPGNQGKAFTALNLRDSGENVILLLRRGSVENQWVKKQGFSHFHLEDLEQLGTIGHSELQTPKAYVILTPDHTHHQLLEKQLIPFFKHPQKIIYVHGYSMVKNQLQQLYPEHSHLLLAPKSIASELRFYYELGRPIGGVYSTQYAHPLEQIDDEELLKQLALSLGITCGPFPTTFQDEMRADLFSEQSFLCSILPYVSNALFNKLINSGLSHELAFLECWHEVKLITHTLIEMGPLKFFDLISPNALIGGEKGRQVLIDGHLLKQIDSLWDDIVSNKFFEEIDHTDIEQTRKKIKDFWQKEPLQQTFDQLKNDLYATKGTL